MNRGIGILIIIIFNDEICTFSFRCVSRLLPRAENIKADFGKQKKKKAEE